MKVATLAEAFNLPVTSHGVHDLTVHLLAAAPNRSHLEVHGFGRDRVIAEPMRIVEGRAIAPDRPGHGVVLDTAAPDRFRTGRGLERVAGIEPAHPAWEAGRLPLHHTRAARMYRACPLPRSSRPCPPAAS